MGKGGAPTTTNTAQNQTVQYTPTGLSGLQNIYNQASQVASTPYQPYGGQLVQGLNPTQTGAISNISNIASQPLTSGQIQQYMNPFQSNVIDATMANINETNQQQQAQTTGQLTQAAGGIGADRIGIGQAELARQQGLASNQTLAGLQQQNYSQAVGTAQQQQGFQLGAAQTQLGAGGVEQQTGQAGLTAAYQQYLQQLAFPYQQTQFLAGVGLPALGAMGGTQNQVGTANQTITPPGVSWLQALTGAGALGYGLTQGGLFGGSGTTAGGGGAATTSGGGADPYAQARGGGIGYADGGGADDDSKSIDLGPGDYHEATDALSPVLNPSSYIPQAKLPTAGDMKPAAMPAMPSIQAPQQQQQQSNSSTLSGLAGLGTTIAKAIPMVAALFREGGSVHNGYDDGGSVPMQQPPSPNMYPSPAMLGRPLTQGALPQSPQMGSPNVHYGTPLPNMLPPSPVVNTGQAGGNAYEQIRQALAQREAGQKLASLRNQMSGQGDDVSVSTQEYARGGSDDKDYSDIGYSRHEDPPPEDRGPFTDVPEQGRQVRPGEPVYPYGGDVVRLRSGGYAPGGVPDDTDDPYSDQNPSTLSRFGNWMAGLLPPPPPGEPSRFAPDPGRAVPPMSQIGSWVNSLLPSPSAAKAAPSPTSQSIPPSPTAAPGASPNPFKLPGQIGDDSPLTGWELGPKAPATTQPTPQRTAVPQTIHIADDTPSTTRMDTSQVPSSINHPTVRGLMNNPDFWVRSGLNILAANPAHGALGAIASGANATIGTYDQWSKDDLSASQKGFELAAKLKEHADKYTRTTPMEKARIQEANQKIDYENRKLEEDRRWHDSIMPSRNAGIVQKYLAANPADIALPPDQQATKAQIWWNTTQDTQQQAPAVGARRQFKQGWGIWNGTAWVPDSG